MQMKIVGLMAGVVCLLASGIAEASIKVEKIATNGTVSLEQTVSSGAAITINSPSAPTYRVYSTDPANESIGLITFTGTNYPYTLTLLIADNTVTTTSTSKFTGIAAQNWAGLSPDGNKITLQARLGRSLKGPVTADHIVRFDIDGNIDASGVLTQKPLGPDALPITAVTTGGDIAGTVLAMDGDINSISCDHDITGTIQATFGNIVLVTCRGLLNPSETSIATIRTNGFGASISTVIISSDMTGQILCDEGNINTITVGGKIIDTNQFSQIMIKASEGINLVRASEFAAPNLSAGVVGCYIIANRFVSTNDQTGFLTDGKIGRLETTTGQSKATVQANSVGTGSNDGIFIAGDLNAEIGFSKYMTSAPSITKPIRISGNLNKPITSDSTLDSTGLISIGGSFNSTIDFRDGKPILGQIIINANNATGAWPTTSHVTRKNGSSTLLDLNNPRYAASEAQLGDNTVGGAVGLAPFRLHAEN